MNTMIPTLRLILPSRRMLRWVLRRADAARDRRDWRDAAAYYAEAMALKPARHDLRVQLGHMLKESGDYGSANEAYMTALAANPLDADLHLQLGHLRKLQDDKTEALRFYQRALELDPASVDALRECLALERDLPKFEPPPGPVEDDPNADATRGPASVTSLFALDASHFAAEVVSFDLFDTLIRRRYIAANEVHDTVSAFVLAMLGRFGAESPGQVTLARYNTTDLLKQSPHVRNEEPSLQQVWTQYIGARIGHGDQVAAMAAEAAAFEYDLDVENLVAIDGAVELLTRLRAAGKRVIAVSDMYYSAAQIDAILERAGLLHLFNQVFVSCDLGLTKQTGNLFRHVCRSLRVEPSQVVHVGDNWRSDVEMPRKLGMRSIHIDQPTMLGMQRPQYGRRPDIHEEVADLVKLFSFHMLLAARSERADHIYFMSRDGCLIRKAIDAWESPIVGTYLERAPRSDLFLSRATSCWLGTNFRDKWLLQSIGHAFWLHHGEATPQQISAILGIPDVPAALEERPYRSDRETFVVLDAYVAAGLEPAIKASLMAKRDQLGRYLEDAGFFDHASAIICDVGYSGTVVRDLNTWFLQESVRADRAKPPRIGFHVIASNANYKGNAVRAAPHAHFSDQVTLPIERIPAPLADSFAWLEMFFKHPTFGPLLGYAEQGGRMLPQYEVAEDPGLAHPAARVLRHMTARGSDIALLWMAAIDFRGQFTDPLMDRFANPDVETISQMLDDIYEADAVTGMTRSVVLVSPALSDDEIYQMAKSRDYWIPGSLTATREAREAERTQAGSAANGRPPDARGTRLGAFIGSVQALEMDGAGPLDLGFYRDFYDDVRELTDPALAAHYREHGRREGRFRSGRHLQRSLEKLYGALPADFDHTAYLWANPDLSPHDPPRWHAVMHYLKHGRGEGRSYHPAMEELDRGFEALVEQKRIELGPEEQAALAEGGTSVRQLVFKRHGIGPGPWLGMLDLCEFGALNWTWCPPLASKAAAVEVFLREGIDRLAPMSLTAAFEPDFYRAQSYGTAGLSDTEAFRHWLRDGCLLGKSPCEGHRLLALIGVTEFPGCFDWKAYLEQHPHRFAPTATRSDVLAGFLNSSDAADVALVSGPGAAALLERMGQHTSARGDRAAALAAYEAALAQGGAPGRLWHKIGDLAFDTRDFRGAIAAYQKGIESPVPDRWSYYKGVFAACEIQAFPIGFHFLDAGMEAWKELEPWRRAKVALFQAWSGTRLAQTGSIAPDLESEGEHEAFIDEYAERLRKYLPTGIALGRPDGPVLVLSEMAPSSRVRAALRTRPVGAGRATAFFSTGEARSFLESLPGASLAILHLSQCDGMAVEAALVARSYGVRTLFWADELGDFPAEGVRADDLAWNPFMLQSPRPEFGRRRSSLHLASLCDGAVTTRASLLPALAAAAKPGCAWLAGRPWMAPLPAGTPAGQANAPGEITILLHPPLDDDRGGPPAPGGGIQGPNALPVAEVLAGLLQRRPGLVVVTERELPPGAAWHRLAARILSPGRQGHPGRVPLEALVDLVLDLTDGRDGCHSHWAAAAAAGVPTLLTAAGLLPWMQQGRDAGVVGAQGLLPALEPLLDDGALRQRIGAAARSAFGARFARQGPGPAAPAVADTRRRILYANVFFPPQSIGGATRVLKDNIDDILASAADRYAISVLTSDDENSNQGATRCDSYRGLPVFRIATPQEIDMDWRMHNAAVGAYARRLLELVKPDLVHIHCLQRLSVSVAEACLALGVPYVVTLHDAWWLSDFAFLVDEEGQPAPPSEALVQQPYNRRIGFPASAERADRLRRALNGAQERLSVSEPFAAYYRQAGFTVRTIANGVSDLAPEPRRAERSGKARVRLGHVGGTQHHKGAYLIEAALRTTTFDNLHFTVVELARDTGDETHTTWGNTPVTITGKFPADRIMELYGRLDVLLAPSTWPESFGLVSREAAACGLWVVASDQGAMGEVVVPGENGFIVDVSTPEGLIRVLCEIDADPARFTKPPARQPPLRSAADQARELIALYDAMMG